MSNHIVLARVQAALRGLWNAVKQKKVEEAFSRALVESQRYHQVRWDGETEHILLPEEVRKRGKHLLQGVILDPVTGDAYLPEEGPYGR